MFVSYTQKKPTKAKSRLVTFECLFYQLWSKTVKIIIRKNTITDFFKTSLFTRSWTSKYLWMSSDLVLLVCVIWFVKNNNDQEIVIAVITSRLLNVNIHEFEYIYFNFIIEINYNDIFQSLAIRHELILSRIHLIWFLKIILIVLWWALYNLEPI